MKGRYTFLALAVCALLMTACHERRAGPMERAGERVDEIGENIREGDPILHREGPAESIGEAIDEARY